MDFCVGARKGYVRPKKGTYMKRITKNWLNEVFNSPPAREVRGRSRWTHRFALRSDLMQTTHYVEGMWEFHAALVLEHLGRVGCIRRYKPQAFDMALLDGRAKSVPDFLVEDSNGEAVVIEIKTYRYLSPQVLQGLQQNEDVLKRAGIRPLLWTDVDPDQRWNKLTRDTIHTIRHVTRGLGIQLTDTQHQQIRSSVFEDTTFGSLLKSFSWDELTACIAATHLHIDIRGPLNEETRVLKNHPNVVNHHFLGTGDAATKWWDSLSNF